MLNNNFLFHVFVGNLLIILYNLNVTRETVEQDGLHIFFCLCFFIFWDHDLKAYNVRLGETICELDLKINLATMP